MGRWQPDARERLERAALALFEQQGFAATTVPQITHTAGLTTRTFFRHFADKRDVLFAGEEHVAGLVAELMAAAPAPLSPMALISQGLHALAALAFEGRLEQLRTRRLIIDTDDGLRERELRKLAALSEVIVAGFRDRGVDELTCLVAAHIGVAAFHLSVTRWLDQDGARPLGTFIDETLRTVRSVTADLTGPPHIAEPVHLQSTP